MTESEIIDFLISHEVIKGSINCPSCGSLLALNRQTLSFRCHNLREVVAKKKKRRCNIRRSAREGSFLEKTHHPLTTYFYLVCHILHTSPPRQQLLMWNYRVSDHFVVDWYSFCREVFIFDAQRTSAKLGGPGKTVEVDEAKFGRRKYNRGRFIEGQWVFGGVERGSGKCFLVPVERRDSATLLQIIEEWILPGTTIISDCWKAYNCLEDAGFVHQRVNHKQNVVDPATLSLIHI